MLCCRCRSWFSTRNFSCVVFTSVFISENVPFMLLQENGSRTDSCGSKRCRQLRQPVWTWSTFKSSWTCGCSRDKPGKPAFVPSGGSCTPNASMNWSDRLGRNHDEMEEWLSEFLVTHTWLYMRVCPSVRRSVVRWSRVFFNRGIQAKKWSNFHQCPCPTCVTDAAVYMALALALAQPQKRVSI